MQVIKKIVEDTDSQNTCKKVDEGGKGAVCRSYVNEKKLREPEKIKKELEQTLKTPILCRSEKERIRSMYNKTIIG